MNDGNSWKEMNTAPLDGTRVLLCFIDPAIGEDYEVGVYVENYGCPGWRAAGTFVNPVAWMRIPSLANTPIDHREASGSTNGSVK